MATEDHQLAALGARRISADTDPDELVLPEESGRRLGWIANWLSQPQLIFGEWGLSRHVDGGLRAMFRGAPGTGKTMAATALARSTERPLFHIDLAAVVCNHAGETEKHLQRLFKTAHDAGAILLFDEADALFGRRSDVRDAHDRYANVEVGYLLRRIEAFDGLAIVTTNLASSIDEGALSRIDVLVEFPMPDEAARKALWTKLLSAVKMLKDEPLDVAALAKHELSGADILRCVRVAALLAATDDRMLDLELLQSAARERLSIRQSGDDRS